MTILNSILSKIVISIFVLMASSSLYSQQLESPKLKFTLHSPTPILLSDIYSLEYPMPEQSLLLTTPQISVFDPFFCRMEYNSAKKSKLQLKMRLGTLEYVDKLEGK